MLWKQTEKTHQILRATSKKQYYLFKMMQRLLPNKDIRINYPHPYDIRQTGVWKTIEFDVYLPELKLALEYLFSGTKQYH